MEAQDLEPRAYSPAPIGTQFFVAAYGYSSGDLAFDAAVPIEDAKGRFHTAAVAYVRAFGLFGRSAKVDVFVPYVWGSADAILSGSPIGIERAGLADPRVRLSLSFRGAPALTGREFAGHRPRTVVGMSLQVAAPLGQYDPSRRINLGANRFSFRPQLGISRPAGRLTLEAYAQAALFTHNPAYLGSSTLEQDPILAGQAHISYTFRPRLWLAVDGLYAWGGRTRVDGFSGLTTRIGADFDTFGIAYQHSWGG